MSELRASAKRLAARGHINQRYNDGSYMEMHLERVAVAAHGIAYREKIKDKELLDVIFCSAIMHDYLEDCFDYSFTSLEDEYKNLAKELNKPIANAVLILSRNNYESDDEYFKTVSENIITKIVKAADRLSNILSLPELKIKKRRDTLFEKYKTQEEYFIKYNIYPEYIRRAIREIEIMLKT
jgi:(p)ppGpp synthase/HD superfamily hydrolase